MYQANPLHVHKQVGGHNFKAFIPVQKGIKKLQSLPKFSEVTESIRTTYIVLKLL